MLAILLVLSPVLSLPQLPAEEDPWLAVINGNNKPSQAAQANEDTNQDSEYYQFEDTKQPQQPQQRYPGPPPPERRVDAGQPQQGYPQPPPQQRLPPPPRGQFRGGQPIQRRPLPPPPPRPQPQKEDAGIIGNIVKGVSDVFQPATCAATNFIAEEKLKDEAFIRSQLDCAMGRAPCDDIGRQIKSKLHLNYIKSILTLLFFSFGPRGAGWQMSRSLQSLYQESNQEGDVSIVTNLSQRIQPDDAAVQKRITIHSPSFSTKII